MLPSQTDASISVEAIELARNDAERDVSKQLWFMAGCCLGGLGFTAAFLTTSEIPIGLGITDRFRCDRYLLSV